MKLKSILKEGKVWERKFGEPLPTLDSVMKKHQGNSKDEVNENFYDDIVKGEVETMLKKSLSTLDHALEEISNYSLSYAGDQKALYFMVKIVNLQFQGCLHVRFWPPSNHTFHSQL